MGGDTMKTLSGPSELAEKERMRLQINAQVEEFLRRGGAIELVSVYTRSARADAGSAGDDLEELTFFDD
jgi:hypothetical protein